MMAHATSGDLEDGWVVLHETYQNSMMCFFMSEKFEIPVGISGGLWVNVLNI
jgi:hypothetical protein